MNCEMFDEWCDQIYRSMSFDFVSARRMRILHCIPGLHRGGAERLGVCATFRRWDAVSTTGLDNENMHGVTDSLSSISYLMASRSR
jgi:hypothetical protein